MKDAAVKLGPEDSRALWAVLEPIHAVVYFGDAHAAAMSRLGMRGWWMGYCASRAAPLGRAPAATIAAVFYNFSPQMIYRALPDAWLYASPNFVLQARQLAVETTLGQLAGRMDPKLVAELAELLVPVAESATCVGRALAAANQALGPPSTHAGRLWWATTVLREQRGDGHVAALVTQGISGIEALVLASLAKEIPRKVYRENRGWSASEWQQAGEGLRGRGLVDEGGLTPDGRRLVSSVELATDIAAGSAWTSLTHADACRIHGLALALSGSLVGDVVPLVNPIGNPWPPPSLSNGQIEPRSRQARDL